MYPGLQSAREQVRAIRTQDGPVYTESAEVLVRPPTAEAGAVLAHGAAQQDQFDVVTAVKRRGDGHAGFDESGRFAGDGGLLGGVTALLLFEREFRHAGPHDHGAPVGAGQPALFLEPAQAAADGHGAQAEAVREFVHGHLPAGGAEFDDAVQARVHFRTCPRGCFPGHRSSSR